MHQNAVFRICNFKIFPGMTPPDPRCGRGDPLTPSLSTARACAAVAVAHTVTPVLGAYILRAGADPENELGGANSGGPPAGSRGGAPVEGLGDKVPQKLTTFRS